MRRFGARLGLFAVLFQVILFGWHHHELSFAGRFAVPVIEKPASAPQLADDEDGCEICQVLHHLTAAPTEFVTASPPAAVATAAASHEAAFLVRAAARRLPRQSPTLA